MTSVPKPFKFLKDHYPKFVETYERLDISLFKVNYINIQKIKNQKELADFLSVLSMVYSKPEERATLKYLQEGT